MGKKYRQHVNTQSSWNQRKKQKKRWKETKLISQITPKSSKFVDEDENQPECSNQETSEQTEDTVDSRVTHVEHSAENDSTEGETPRKKKKKSSDTVENETKNKKKFTEEEAEISQNKTENSVSNKRNYSTATDAHKFVPKQRSGTLSLAIPGSILTNAQSNELRTYLAGQIARAAAIFCVDEIVVFDEYAALSKKDIQIFDQMLDSSQVESRSRCNVQLARILQYLECPQYLRRFMFSLSNDFKLAGLLNPMDCPHHMRADDLSIPYREAVVINKPVSQGGKGSFCNAGLSKEVRVDMQIQPGVRVTVKLSTFDLDKPVLQGTVVSPSLPKDEGGLYWGYNVRLAPSLGAVFTECPYENGYDCTIGTSERGTAVEELQFEESKHLLVVFGGLRGLESCLENDQSVQEDDPKSLFDYYVNTCAEQGSRTIRTEEAILISLSALRLLRSGS